MERRRTDRRGRFALLGCGAAVLLLFSIAVGCAASYAAGVAAVHYLPGYQAAISAVEARELKAPLLGAPVSSGTWLGLQLARDDDRKLELRVRSYATGTLNQGTIYITLQSAPDGMRPTSILLDVDGEIIDVIAENAESADIMADEQRGTLVAEARRLLDLNRPGQALSFADDAVALDAHDPDARAVRADIRRQLNDLAGAETDALEALNLDPSHPEGLRAMAHVQRVLERWDACIDTATTRIRDDPRDGRAWTVRAMCYEGAGMPRKALTGAREGCSQGDPDGCALAGALEQ